MSRARLVFPVVKGRNELSLVVPIPATFGHSHPYNDPHCGTHLPNRLDVDAATSAAYYSREFGLAWQEDHLVLIPPWCGADVKVTGGDITFGQAITATRAAISMLRI